MRKDMLEPSCCSIVKFHSFTVGVFAAASMPCGANVLHGAGTVPTGGAVGPQAGGGRMPARNVRLRRSLMESSAYQAPNQLLKPNSVGLGTTWKLVVVP